MGTVSSTTLSRRAWFWELFRKFAQLEAASSIVLLAATLAALGLANSPLAEAYRRIQLTPLSVSLGPETLAWPLVEWVNDALMAVFFLVVGLEVKREILVGELASVRKALLPIIAAVGGMLLPTLIYLSLNHSGQAQRGFGIPMATDVAFSLAILAAFGRRIPIALKMFLATLAIADDVGGVLVIAVAYSGGLHWFWLAGSGLVFGCCLVLNRLGVSRLGVYLSAGVLLWVALHASGIHPALGGVILAMAIPSRAFLSSEQFIQHGHKRLEQFRHARRVPQSRQEAHRHLSQLHNSLELAESPLDRLIDALHPWVSFGIMPLFAVMNAGVSMRHFSAAMLLQPTFLGIALGLVLGKPLGIMAASWIAVRLRFAELPSSLTWGQLHAVGWIAGIGFTVAIFVANLAFGQSAQYTEARTAVLFASTLAAGLGATLLRATKPERDANTAR